MDKIEDCNPAPSEPTKVVLSKPKRRKSTHPRIAQMVNKAIQELNAGKGSSLMLIKKYLAVNYMVNPDKMTIFIKKYVKKAVEDKILIQTKGKGFAGSFKIAGKPLKIQGNHKPHTLGVTKVAKGTQRSSKKKVPSKQGSRESTRASAQNSKMKVSATRMP